MPPDLADLAAAMTPMHAALDIAHIASITRHDLQQTAEIYFGLADRLQITRLHDRISTLPGEDRWPAAARAALHDDLYAAHASLAEQALNAGDLATDGAPADRLAIWESRNQEAVTMAIRITADLQETESSTFTNVPLAVRAIRTLAAASSLPPAE